MAAILWTKDEDAVVREHYPKHGTKACAKLLPAHRTLYAIARRATTLGVCRAFSMPMPDTSRNRMRSRACLVRDTPSIEAGSVEEWLAKGGVIEYPQPTPFQNITPSPIKARPLVMPMRVLGRCA